MLAIFINVYYCFYTQTLRRTHMKKLLALTVVLALGSFGLFFTGCGNEETLQTLYGIAANTEGLESLVVLISYIDQYGEESDIEGDFKDTTITATAFAPNNEAFVELFEAEGTVLTETDISNFADSFGISDAEMAGYLGEIIGLHVIVDQKLYKADIISDADGEIGPTEWDEVIDVYLLVSVVGETVTLTPDIEGSTSADIITADIEASNGIAHIIDAVMWPPPPVPE
jgi:hypothetical protein